MQGTGENSDYLRNKWLQFLQAIAGGKHDNDRDWQSVQVLLVRYSLVNCDHGIEVTTCCQVE
ncbi:MAG: hypothetical protein OXC42_02945 [Gammaproteobacteria bacterium]|nr:hypothetical protein [Gammaproteobacteria bacterium]